VFLVCFGSEYFKFWFFSLSSYCVYWGSSLFLFSLMESAGQNAFYAFLVIEFSFVDLLLTFSLCLDYVCKTSIWPVVTKEVCRKYGPTFISELRDNYTDVGRQACASSLHIFPPLASLRNIMFTDKRTNAMSRDSFVWIKQNPHAYTEVGGSLNLEFFKSRIRGFSGRSKNFYLQTSIYFISVTFHLFQM